MLTDQFLRGNRPRLPPLSAQKHFYSDTHQGKNGGLRISHLWKRKTFQLHKIRQSKVSHRLGDGRTRRHRSISKGEGTDWLHLIRGLFSFILKFLWSSPHDWVSLQDSFLAENWRMLHIPEIHQIHLVNLLFSWYSSVFVTGSPDTGRCQSLVVTSVPGPCALIRQWYGQNQKQGQFIIKEYTYRGGVAKTKKKDGQLEGLHLERAFVSLKVSFESHWHNVGFLCYLEFYTQLHGLRVSLAS